MAQEFTKIQSRAIAIALMIPGVWLLHKPLVAIVHLARTGELGTLRLKRGWPITQWFEATVHPLSVEGFKSWTAYALMLIFAGMVWAAIVGLLFGDFIDGRRFFKWLLYAIYAAFAAVVVIVLFDWRIIRL